MTVIKKIKGINNKIEGNKDQCDLAKISVLPSGNISKYEFLAEKDVVVEKDLLKRTASMKRFEYSSLGKDSKAQTDIAKKQYQGLDKIYEFDETINKKQHLKGITKLDLMYNSNYNFYISYGDSKKIDKLSSESKHANRLAQ